jgi:hypothetical protein
MVAPFVIGNRVRSLFFCLADSMSLGALADCYHPKSGFSEAEAGPKKPHSGKATQYKGTPLE